MKEQIYTLEGQLVNLQPGVTNADHMPESLMYISEPTYRIDREELQKLVNVCIEKEYKGCVMA